MRLYLDDDSAAKDLAGFLRKRGHDVFKPADCGTVGVSDPKHLAHAIQQRLVLLTRNHDDFLDLHKLLIVGGGSHPGILAVRFDNDPTRDMKTGDMVRAISRFEAAIGDPASTFVVLNHWR